MSSIIETPTSSNSSIITNISPISSNIISSSSDILVSSPFSPFSSPSVIISDPFLPVDSISSVIPLVSSPFSPISPLSPLSPLTLSFDYSRPLVGVYDTIDTNPEVRRKMTNYIYDLVRDKWLLDELNDILNYFKYSDGKVKMIKSFSEYSPTNIAKDTDKIAEKKVEYIEDYLLTKHDLEAILSKFVKDTQTKWVNLTNNEFYLRQAIKEYLMKQITKKLKKKAEKQEGGGSNKTLADHLFFFCTAER